MSLQYLFDRLQPRALWWPRLFSAVAAALLLWLAARLIWLLLAGPALPPVQLPPDPSLSASQPAAPVRISQWHLFGHASAPLDLSKLADQAPATSLQLFLRGTLNESAPNGGIAIIADGSGADRPYRVGDDLPGGARLEAIYAGRVLLSRAGQTESLSLPRAALGSAAGGAAPNAPITPSAPPGAAPAAASGGYVQSAGVFGVPSLESQRATANVDVAKLAKEVSVYPVLENGRFAGVRLGVNRDSDLLQRTGLRPTDVITAVNGIPLDGPARQEELLTALRDARSLNVTIRRDGETQNLTIAF